MVVSRGKARYQRGHSAQYNGFKLATSTFVLSILEFIFTAASHKHCAFTIIYELIDNLIDELTAKLIYELNDELVELTIIRQTRVDNVKFRHVLFNKKCRKTKTKTSNNLTFPSILPRK